MKNQVKNSKKGKGRKNICKWKYHTGAEQESSILKSYKHVVNVPITPPSAPCLGVAAKPI